MGEITDPLTAADASLADCELAIAKLHKLCCEPERSPRLAALADAIADLRADVRAVAADAGLIEHAISRLEDLGADVGRLQVACCAPSRMPLYGRLLNAFSSTQIALNRRRGTAH